MQILRHLVLRRRTSFIAKWLSGRKWCAFWSLLQKSKRFFFHVCVKKLIKRNVTMTFVKVHLRPFTLKSKTTDVAFKN